MKPASIIELVGDRLAPAAERERAACKRIDALLNATGNEHPFLDLGRPEGDRAKIKAQLKELAATPLLRLIVEETAQHMIADGVTSDGGRDTRTMWDAFERNAFPSRQGALYAAALSYGSAYMLALPGRSQTIEGTAAALSMYSPKHLHVVYADMAEDEWPLYALRVIPQGGTTAFRLIDEEAEHFLARNERGRLEFIESRPHGLGVCPVIRYAPNADIDGVSMGEPERFKTVAQRHAKSTHDRLSAQHFNSWRVRYVTGLEEPGTPEEQQRQSAALSHSDLLTGGDGVTFGTLAETSLDGLLKAEDADLHTLAAVAQKPVWSLAGGQLVNLSADAIAEARSTERLKIQAFQRAVGRSHTQALRLASFIEGRAEDAADFGLHITWQDTEARSLSQAADALGKIASQLAVPPAMLWDMIPGVTPTKAREWAAYASEHPSVDEALIAHLSPQDSPYGTE